MTPRSTRCAAIDRPPMSLTIGLDAMGGDDAPDMVLKGADLALNRFPQLDYVLLRHLAVVHRVYARSELVRH